MCQRGRASRAYLDDAVERAAVSDQQIGLMIVGLDGFRAVNDIWGHAVGDEVLRLTAERLKTIGHDPGQVARVAGDEFALVIEGEAAGDMRQLADKVRALLNEPFEVDGSSILLGAGIGAALYPINAETGRVPLPRRRQRSFPRQGDGAERARCLRHRDEAADRGRARRSSGT